MNHAEPTGPIVRVAGPADVEGAGALTAEAYLADRLLAGDDDGYENELRDARRRADQAVLLVAVVPAGTGEAVVGTVTLAAYGSSYAEIAEPGEWELRMLAVAPESRRRGLAEQLVLAALREAVAGGARQVVLSTLGSMHAAHRLYERLGFRPAPARDWRHEEVRLAVHEWTAPGAPGALVEQATWPPVRTVQVGDWRLGLSGGVTRRANSVLALAAPVDLDEAITAVEDVYAAELLPTTFRVERDGRHDELLRVLLGRGYREVAATDVLVRSVQGAPVPAQVRSLDVVATDEPGPGWLAAWGSGKGATVELAAAILTGAPAQYLSAVRDGHLVGIARVAYDQDWAGLSSLAVTPQARRTGVAGVLTARAMALAHRRGATRMFLQVEALNTAAWRLYAAIGFRPAARYAYLVRD